VTYNRLHPARSLNGDFSNGGIRGIAGRPRDTQTFFEIRSRHFGHRVIVPWHVKRLRSFDLDKNVKPVGASAPPSHCRNKAGIGTGDSFVRRRGCLREVPQQRREGEAGKRLAPPLADQPIRARLGRRAAANWSLKTRIGKKNEFVAGSELFSAAERSRNQGLWLPSIRSSDHVQCCSRCSFRQSFSEGPVGYVGSVLPGCCTANSPSVSEK